MTVVCTLDDCVNKGKECCTANRILIDENGCCACYISYDKFIRKNKYVNKDKC
jgi:hypothetical protein